MTFKKDRIFWAVIFILGAVGLILRAVNPGLAIFELPLWKWFLGALILYWLLNNVIGGRTLARHLDVFFPLGFAYILLREQLAGWFGFDKDVINPWIVLLIAALLHMANHLIFDHFTRSNRLIVIDGDKGSTEKEEAYANRNSFSSRAVYLDALKANHYVMNRFGQQEVYFQNTDVVNGPETIELKVSNAFGQTIVHVPSDWAVKNDVDNSMGSVDGQIRETGSRTLHLTGTNRFGELSIEQG